MMHVAKSCVALAALLLAASVAADDYIQLMDPEDPESWEVFCAISVVPSGGASIGGIPIGTIGPGGGTSPEGGSGGTSSHSTEPPSAYQQIRLDQAKADAFAKLSATTSCGTSLWADSGLWPDPVSVISSTSYRNGINTTTCINNPAAGAWTRVNSRIVNLCFGFMAMPAADLWLVPIHEAMHGAGMQEYPPAPYLTSEQINARIRQYCPC